MSSRLSARARSVATIDICTFYPYAYFIMPKTITKQIRSRNEISIRPLTRHRQKSGMPSAIKMTTLRDNLADAIKRAQEEEILLITKNNEPVSALVDIDYLEDLLTLSNPEFMKTLEEARKSKKRYTFEEAFPDLV